MALGGGFVARGGVGGGGGAMVATMGKKRGDGCSGVTAGGETASGS